MNEATTIRVLLFMLVSFLILVSQGSVSASR
jgi:hypothetical protein